MNYKKHFTYYLILLILLFGGTNSYAQLVTNNGALVSIKAGAIVMVRTGAVNNTNAGTFDNAGTVTIEGYFENNALANGGGAAGVYRVQGNWINNSVFVANSSQVELYGANQLITGIAITEYYRLTLTGTGIKTQTINSRVNNLLELNDRELATDLFKMFIITPNINAITRTTGFVSSLGAGRLVRNTNSVNDYLFPVGSSLITTRYRPIIARPSTAALQDIQVRMANVDATLEGYDRNIKQAQICLVNPLYFHKIGRLSGTDPLRLVFFYDQILDGTFASVAHWQIVPEWQDIGPTISGVSAPFNTHTIASWNNFTQEEFALVKIAPTASISGATSICVGTGTSITFTGTPNATVTYTVNGGANQTIVLDGSGNATLPTGNLAVTTTYNLVSVSVAGPPVCSQPLVGAAIVAIVPLSNAGTNGSITLCSSDSPVNLFTSLVGTPQATGTWGGPSALTGGNLGTFTPGVNIAGAYSYTVAGTAPCPNATANVNVVITPNPLLSPLFHD